MSTPEEQMRLVDLAVDYGLVVRKQGYSLCTHMHSCPTEVERGVTTTCGNCIGQIPMDALEEIQPELDKSNLVVTIHLWRALFQ